MEYATVPVPQSRGTQQEAPEKPLAEERRSQNSAVIPAGSPRRRPGDFRLVVPSSWSAAMTTATTSRASSSSIGSSMPGWPLRSRVRFTARTALAGTSAGATGSGLCASISRRGGSCQSGNPPNAYPSRGDAHALEEAILRCCVRFLTAMMPVRSCLCTDRERRVRILVLGSALTRSLGYGEQCLRLVTDGTLDKPYPSGSKALSMPMISLG